MVRIRAARRWRFSGLVDPAAPFPTSRPSPSPCAVEVEAALVARCYAGRVKRLHRSDLWGWSRFDESRNVDFNSVVWVNPAGNVAIDPLPLGDHDRAHLESLGGVAFIVITNSDHVRGTAELAALTGARIFGPAGERDGFPIACDRYLSDGDEVVAGLTAIALDGSKTPGELALLLDGSTLVTGDLVRAHRAGGLDLLPVGKLADRGTAIGSLRRLVALPGIEAVLVGDGWPVFRGGGDALRELLAANA
jgi:hypothetical protein